ncbi:uncharacterized protein LOC141641644 [Silene latifolia]|uniref:uncharacterized protein LOC141641644 n=1 Tax=Silene latifolia TaxID=37657 RepID=UPI003D78523D
MAHRPSDNTYYDFMGSEGGSRELDASYPIKVQLTSDDVQPGAKKVYLNDHTSVQANIIDGLIPGFRSILRSEGSLKLLIHDTDTNLEFKDYRFTFKNNGYYLESKKWSRDFVQRRNLKAGDRIGFRYKGAYTQTLQFSVIARGPRH